MGEQWLPLTEVPGLKALLQQHDEADAAAEAGTYDRNEMVFDPTATEAAAQPQLDQESAAALAKGAKEEVRSARLIYQSLSRKSLCALVTV